MATMTMKTNMIGLMKWIAAHPRKNLAGFFSCNGRELTHNEVKLVVDYAVKNGYKTEADIPDEEVAALLKWDEQ